MNLYYIVILTIIYIVSIILYRIKYIDTINKQIMNKTKIKIMEFRTFFKIATTLYLLPFIFFIVVFLGRDNFMVERLFYTRDEHLIVINNESIQLPIDNFILDYRYSDTGARYKTNKSFKDISDFFKRLDNIGENIIVNHSNTSITLYYDQKYIYVDHIVEGNKKYVVIDIMDRDHSISPKKKMLYDLTNQLRSENPNYRLGVMGFINNTDYVVGIIKWRDDKENTKNTKIISIPIHDETNYQVLQEYSMDMKAQSYMPVIIEYNLVQINNYLLYQDVDLIWKLQSLIDGEIYSSNENESKYDVETYDPTEALIGDNLFLLKYKFKDQVLAFNTKTKDFNIIELK